jgi:cytochrome c-type biogenesis protein CcmH/NrfG
LTLHGVGSQWGSCGTVSFEYGSAVKQGKMIETGSSWNARQVYVSAAICLALGVTLGYLFRGSGSGSSAASRPGTQPTPSSMAQMPTLEQMKQMADQQAAPLLAKLQTDPKNTGLLVQIGRVYESAHQFKDAANYYDKSLALDPKNVIIRNEMASCLYYTGDVDGALGQLERSLKDDPRNANSLFNLGMIRWQAKKDAGGAVTAWKQLLKLNPNLEDQKKAQVQRLIADASQNGGLPREAQNKLKE